jgi:ABC-type glycerol-3-phosphate transport system substrate-binding protein
MIARQNYDSEKELVAASAGAAKFTDPKYAEYWSRLNELKEAGCWNKDINSVDYQQGQDLFTQGKSAMLFGNDTFLKGFADTMGSWDKIGLMLVPKYGSGKLADTYTVTGQGWGITSWTKYPQEAADFLVYMHTPERLAAWFTDTGVAPADDRMDPSLISQPQLKQVYKWETTVPGPNLENWIPGIVDHDAMMTGAQLLFSGDNTPAQLAQMTEDVVVKWRDQNPDAVKNFVILAK